MAHCVQLCSINNRMRSRDPTAYNSAHDFDECALQPGLTIKVDEQPT